MPNIIFVTPDGTEHNVVVENGTTVMEAGRDANLGIEGTCGGCLSGSYFIAAGVGSRWAYAE